VSTAEKSRKSRSRLDSVLGLPGPATNEPFLVSPTLSAEGPHCRTIGRCGQAQGARRQRDHCTVLPVMSKTRRNSLLRRHGRLDEAFLYSESIDLTSLRVACRAVALATATRRESEGW
jgi:hypothetical protein